MSNIVYACHVSYYMWPMCFMRHAASILSHIPNGMHHFMHHAQSQSLTPYSSLIFNVDSKWNAFYAHVPSQCVTPYRIQVSYSMWNVKLCKSCTISMPHTVCHVSFHVEFDALCVVHHITGVMSNTDCMLCQFPCWMWNFMRHAQSQR